MSMRDGAIPILIGPSPVLAIGQTNLGAAQLELAVGSTSVPMNSSAPVFLSTIA